MPQRITYADAGVDIDKANSFISTIKSIAGETSRSGVMSDIGGFGGLFSLNAANYTNPVLVSSTDGVGTKLKIAFMMNRHNTIGIDLVAMCVNDVAVQGAKPLFFLDYISMGKLDTGVAGDIIRGIAEGCKQAKCALIGGETAEMPGLYTTGEYDLAGFTVGVVENDKIIDGSDIRVGDRLIGVASSGVHSNGFSLARKVCFEISKLGIDAYIPELNRTLGEELITPTRIYSEMIQSVIRDLPVNGMAHITGGGIPDNIVRIIPNACQVQIKRGSWEIPPIFSFLQERGNISESEMMRTFNNGIGLIMVVPDSSVQEIQERLQAMNEKAFIIGDIVERKEPDERIIWV